FSSARPLLHVVLIDMRLSHRLIGSLVAAVALASLAFAWVDVHRGTRLLQQELERRAATEGAHIEQVITPFLKAGTLHRAAPVLDRLRTQEGFAGVMIFDDTGDAVVRAPVVDDDLAKRVRGVVEAADGANGDVFVKGPTGRVLIHAVATGSTTPP